MFVQLNKVLYSKQLLVCDTVIALSSVEGATTMCSDSLSPILYLRQDSTNTDITGISVQIKSQSSRGYAIMSGPTSTDFRR